jgi:predicted Zn-dependent protease
MSNSFLKLYRQCRRRWVYGLLSLMMASGLILTTPQPGQAVSIFDLILRGVQIIQLSTLSDRQEVSIGKQINDKLVAEELNLYTDRSVNSYINEIGQRLVPYSDRSNIPYTFQVVEDSKINAFATMGGYVYVTTGLIRAADNEAQLASVISHEIGHIASRHAIEQMRESALAQGIVTAAGMDRNAAVNIGVELALRRPNSRRDEFEADQRGLATLTAAGYAPGAMVDFMEKLANQASLPAFLSTHPAVPDRIRALNQAIDPASANYGSGLDGAAYRSRIGSLS